MNDDFQLIEGLALIIVPVTYFAPTLLAFSKGRRNASAIFILNLFAGWTGFGWVGALVWAFVVDV